MNFNKWIQSKDNNWNKLILNLLSRSDSIKKWNKILLIKLTNCMHKLIPRVWKLNIFILRIILCMKNIEILNISSNKLRGISRYYLKSYSRWFFKTIGKNFAN